MPAVWIDQNCAPIKHSRGLKMKVWPRRTSRVARCTDDIACAHSVPDSNVNPVEMTITGTDDVDAVRSRLNFHDFCTQTGLAATGHRLLLGPDDPSSRHRE